MSPLDLPPQKNLEAEFAAVARAMGKDAHAPSDRTLLTLGDEQLGVLRSGAGGLDAVKWIGIGPAHIAHRYFQHDPPRPQDIERAIDLVEDEIMRLGKPAEDGTTLWVTGLDMRAWAAIPGRTVPIETVEQWFQRLASVAGMGMNDSSYSSVRLFGDDAEGEANLALVDLDGQPPPLAGGRRGG